MGDGLTYSESTTFIFGVLLLLGQHAGSHFQGGRFDEVLRFLVMDKQGLQIPAKLQIRTARAIQKFASLCFAMLQCGVVELLQTARSLSVHRPSLRSLLRSVLPSFL